MDKSALLPDKDTLSEMLKITAAMAQDDSVMSLLNRGLLLCVSILSCDRGLLIAEPGDGTPCSILLHQGAGNRTSAFSRTAVRLVKEKGEPLLISDAITDTFLSTQESISGNDIRSILCSSLNTGNFRSQTGKQVYLYLDSTTSRHSFSLTDLERFRLLTSFMAGLIRKSTLLEEQEITIEELKAQVRQQQGDSLIFKSQSFEQCLRIVKQGAATDVPILLTGETGTGKEVIARLVHTMSKRKDKPYLAINCGAIPGNLIESELFGHEKGAFTGAIAQKKGYFEEASGGTLLLDEIGEMPLATQTRLLRVLQEGEIMRVGSTRAIPVDVRIVSATNVDLEKSVENNLFRSDLYYRLSAFPVSIPPVRNRGEDSLLLAHFFLKQFGSLYGSIANRFSAEAEKTILGYDWPGNVRQIQNCIQRAVITASEPVIQSQSLGIAGKTGTRHSTLKEARETVELEMVRYALDRFPDNLTNAAKILDIDRKSLRLLMEKFGLSKET